MSIKRDVQPDGDGFVPFLVEGKVSARYHPGRREIELVRRRVRKVFRLAEYEE
jgi:hypothetical protein